MALDWVGIGSAILGAGASIFGGNKAADAMKDASGQSNAVAREIYGQQRADQMPYMQSGYQALNALNRLYGLGQVDTDIAAQGTGPNGLRPTQIMQGKKMVYVDQNGNGYVFASHGENAGEQYPAGYYAQYDTRKNKPKGQQAQQAAGDRYGGFYASPGYQFRLDEGTRAMDRSAAARGMLLSGAQNKALTRYGQGVASEEFMNYSNALRNIAGLGQVSNQSVSGAAGQYGVNAANAAMGSGMARASGYMGTANTIGSVANGVLASIPYWSANRAVPSQGAGYAAPGTGGFMPIQNPF